MKKQSLHITLRGVKQKEIKKMRRYLLPRKENDIGVVLLRGGEQEIVYLSLC